MKKILQEYKNHLLINEKDTSTINTYISKIEVFLNNVKTENIDEKNINEFLLKMRTKYKTSTMNLYKTALNSFLKYLKKDIEIPKQKTPKKNLPEYFTEKYFKEEIIPVIESVFKNPLKIKTIFYFLFYTGIRVGEFKYIKRKNINLENREVKIYVEKRNEERIVFFNEETRDILKAFFISEPEGSNAFNIEVKTIQTHCRNLKQYFKDINFHPHLFRHSFSRMFLMNGGSLSDLQDALGHKSPNTTRIYAGLKTEQRKQIYDKIMRNKK